MQHRGLTCIMSYRVRIGTGLGSPKVPLFHIGRGMALSYIMYYPSRDPGFALAQEKDKKKTGIFEAPVYRTKKRTGLNYITSFSLKTDESPSKWIMRGVALLCTME